MVHAASGTEAWVLVQQHADIALVISDWTMPGKTGPELIGLIRREARADYIYCILLTAKSRTEDIVEGMRAGAGDFLTKPFDRNELEVRLRAGERVVELEQTSPGAMQSWRPQTYACGVICKQRRWCNERFCRPSCRAGRPPYLLGRSNRAKSFPEIASASCSSMNASPPCTCWMLADTA